MRVLSVYGGETLNGEVVVQGAKNSVLPILAATVLAQETCVLHNCPDLEDVDAAIDILRWLGASVQRQADTLLVDPTGICRTEIPQEQMERMRSSVIFLGAILARCGEATISEPGGCRLGARPIDFHLQALQTMGVVIKSEQGRISCCAAQMHTCQICLPYASVGATENVMLAAMGCSGQVVLKNAAREPEILDLAVFLRALGARIGGDGTGTIILQAPEQLRYAEHWVIPDRIVAATYLCAVAAAGGEVCLRQLQPSHLDAVLQVLQQMGCTVRRAKHALVLRRSGKLCAPEKIETAPYPGFPTDVQAPMMAALLRAEGESQIRETVFPSRFYHVPQLQKLGGWIEVCDEQTRIFGVKSLHGAQMEATDLRGGAALVIAALAAEGESIITGLHHINRGYESIERDLRALGAKIQRREVEAY